MITTCVMDIRSGDDLNRLGPLSGPIPEGPARSWHDLAVAIVPTLVAGSEKKQSYDMGQLASDRRLPCVPNTFFAIRGRKTMRRVLTIELLLTK